MPPELYWPGVNPSQAANCRPHRNSWPRPIIATTAVTAGGPTTLFSGDLGRYDDPLMRGPDAPAAADTLVMESTYGDRRHPRSSSRALTVMCRSYCAMRSSMSLLA